MEPVHKNQGSWESNKYPSEQLYSEAFKFSQFDWTPSTIEVHNVKLTGPCHTVAMGIEPPISVIVTTSADDSCSASGVQRTNRCRSSVPTD